MITGVDLVKLQIRAAAGERLNLAQSDIKVLGHAIECRINAENPSTFRPSPGSVSEYYIPGGPGVRVDSNLYTGYTVLPYYDSLIAKLIVIGADRGEAIARMKRSLDEFIVQGIETSIPLHKQIMEHFAFVRGEVGTDFIDRYFL
jgi:acetyl-CoA carboxylase biotin carboxylase subunit